MPDAIIMEGVTKRFGEKVAVDALDLRVPEGALYGFIGPNGAGKTTSIRMIMSIIFPNSGRLSVLGKASAVESKDRIGYLPEERGVYRKMRVAGFLAYMARLKGMDAGPELRRRIGSWLERVGLEDVGGRRCEELSKGMQQKVQFITAVIHDPALLILDEPFSGLDPVNMRLMRDLFIEQHRRGATIIFSTHVMHQAEQICDHVVMINRGRKVLDESIDSIRSRFDPRTIEVDPIDPGVDVNALTSIPGVAGVERIERTIRIAVEQDADTGAVVRAAADAVPFRRVELLRASLEDVFIELVQSGGDEGEAHELRAQLQEASPTVGARHA